MKVLVVGARGQVGADVVEAALSFPGLEVEGLDRRALDLAKLDEVPGRLGGHRFDTLINCAAYTEVDGAESDVGRALAVNARAVEVLAEVCRKRGAGFVHLSTDYVFDGLRQRPYTPEDPPAPLNVYGASKLMGEALARKVYSPATVIVRTSSVFGVAGLRPGGGGNFVETMLKLARERPSLRVVADNEMAPTFSGDLAQALLKLVHGNPNPGIYHLTNEGRTSWHGLAEAALEIAGLEVEVEPISAAQYPTPARRPTFSVLDTSRTTELCGPMPHWRDALARYLTLRSDDANSTSTQTT